MPYRKAILKAVEELRDSHLRSSIDAIYRHVESNLPDGTECNYPMFLANLKSLVEDGDLEMTPMHCSLSPEYKRRRTTEIQDMITKLQAISSRRGSFSAGPPSLAKPDHAKHKAARRRQLEHYTW
jgi:hypothetical protein